MFHILKTRKFSTIPFVGYSLQEGPEVFCDYE